MQLRKLIYVMLAGVCITFLLWMMGCRKESNHNSIGLSGETAGVRTWLHQQGGTYSNETIQVQSPEGRLLSGSLDWEQSHAYVVGGRDYLDVPYRFGSRDIAVHNDSIGSISMTLVVRRDSAGGYEGAVRTLVLDGMTTDCLTGVKIRRTMASYQLLDGSPSTLWSATNGGKYIEGCRLKQGESIDYVMRLLGGSSSRGGSGSSKGLQAMAPGSPPGGGGCTTFTTTTYQVSCTVIGDPQTSGYYSCISIPVSVTQTVCIDGSSDNNYGGDGGGSSGGPVPGGWPSPPQPKIPCEQGAKAAAVANNIIGSQNIPQKIADYKSSLATAPAEKGFSIVKVGDSYIAQAEQTGTASAVNIIASDPYNVIVGGFHIHTSSVKGYPSPGDMYSLLTANGKNAGFTHYFTQSSSGLYDFVITDAAKAAAFLKNYPIGTHVSGLSDVANFGYDSPLYRDYDNARLQMSEISGISQDDINAYAYACIFDKFDAGVVLLKADASGKMQPLLYKESKDANGNSTYTSIPCGGTTSSSTSVGIE